MSQELRKIAISHFNGENITNDDKTKIKNLTTYMEAYCSEMKCNEQDVLLDDEHYDKVYKLYKSVMYR